MTGQKGWKFLSIDILGTYCYNILIMETNPQVQNICSLCHQPILPQYYFCPNCGNKINATPLATTVRTQVKIYLFSLILPLICFIFITRWPGVKYFKSADPKAKRIGEIAWVILILSSIIVIWLGIVWTQEFIQSSVNSMNVDLNSLGY